jgi:hypothetical protein
MLILIIAGQPERGVEVCSTYQACSDDGLAMQDEYQKQHGAVVDFSYRVQPVLIVPEEGKGSGT